MKVRSKPGRTHAAPPKTRRFKPITTEEFNAVLARNVRALRRKLRITPSELARRAGLAPATIRAIESARSTARIRTLYKLAIGLGIISEEDRKDIKAGRGTLTAGSVFLVLFKGLRDF